MIKVLAEWEKVQEEQWKMSRDAGWQLRETKRQEQKKLRKENRQKQKKNSEASSSSSEDQEDQEEQEEEQIERKEWKEEQEAALEGDRKKRERIEEMKKEWQIVVEAEEKERAKNHTLLKALEKAVREGKLHSVCKGKPVADTEPVTDIKREEDYRKGMKDELKTYGGSIRKIKFGKRHFWYNSPKESYIVGDCGLYAVVRFLLHAGHIGAIDGVDKNLWKTSNKELRNMLADNLSDKKRGKECRKPKEWLSSGEIVELLRGLGVPNPRDHILLMDDMYNFSEDLENQNSKT